MARSGKGGRGPSSADAPGNAGANAPGQPGAPGVSGGAADAVNAAVQQFAKILGVDTVPNAVATALGALGFPGPIGILGAGIVDAEMSRTSPNVNTSKGNQAATAGNQGGGKSKNPAIADNPFNLALVTPNISGTIETPKINGIDLPDVNSLAQIETIKSSGILLGGTGSIAVDDKFADPTIKAQGPLSKKAASRSEKTTTQQMFSNLLRENFLNS